MWMPLSPRVCTSVSVKGMNCSEVIPSYFHRNVSASCFFEASGDNPKLQLLKNKNQTLYLTVILSQLQSQRVVMAPWVWRVLKYPESPGDPPPVASSQMTAICSRGRNVFWDSCAESLLLRRARCPLFVQHNEDVGNSWGSGNRFLIHHSVTTRTLTTGELKFM